MQTAEIAAEPNASGNESLLGGLDFLWLELTDKCNLACIHCYADSSPLLPLFQGMQLPDWKRILADSYEAGCRKVQFIGGEPTLYPHLIELIQYSRALGYELVEVFTNGTAFNERIKQAFRECRVNLAFSVYADGPSVHDSITLRAGSFSKTVESIKWALKNDLEVRVAAVEMSQNSSAIDATRKLFEELGVTEVRIDRTRGVGRGSTGKDATSPFDELCGSCWQGKLCVTPTGDMFPCVFSRCWLVGTAAEGVKAALEGHRLFAFRSTLRSKLQSEPANCSPARKRNDDDRCNPKRDAVALPKHYQDRAGCNPDQQCGPDLAPCSPSRTMGALPPHHQDRGKCNPESEEKCAPVKRDQTPESSF